MSGRCFLASVGSLALALSTAACGADEAGDPSRPVGPITIRSETFGVNGHVLRAASARGEVEIVDRQLASIQRGGLSFVRANVDWGQFEPNPPVNGVHSFEYMGTDAWVEALAEHGIRWHAIGVGASTPSWAVSTTAAQAGCGGRSPPAEPGLLAEMMAAVAERYGRSGSFWSEHPELEELPVTAYEVWNEPNHGAFWCPAPEPATFAEFFMQAAEAVRNVDPSARMVLGGLAPFHETVEARPGVAAKMDVATFLAGVVEARPDLPETVSAVGAHTYGDPSIILDDLAFYRASLDSLGMADVPISLNEVGWPTAGDEISPVPEATRADYIMEVTRSAILSNCDVESFAPHTWVTEEADPADAEHWFGIADPLTGDPYPVAEAYFSEVEAALSAPRVAASEVSALCA